MRAALAFVRGLEQSGLLERCRRVEVNLYGSLALTGIGHGTDRAVLLGLSGEEPATVELESTAIILTEVHEGRLLLGGRRRVPFSRTQDLLLHTAQMYPDADTPTHPNGMRFRALFEAGEPVREEVFYSIGGGFIATEKEWETRLTGTAERTRPVPFPFRSASELLRVAEQHGLTIAEVVLHNEAAMRKSAMRQESLVVADALAEHRAVQEGVLAVWKAMLDSMERGMTTEGILPGGLQVRRRAPRLTERIRTKGSADPLAPLDWVTIFAIAVNEENAAGGRVVTAPTNGAAGVVPAVARYYRDFVSGADEDGLLRYFLTAAAIGMLYKENASISGAEVGCQGEVGVACSMAAGGLAAALRGSNAQVEHAAEIAMEHNLGMTCDPIGGLVQIPCIERNAVGAVKAVNATRMAMNELDEHKVSLDQVIRTMYLTGMDMQSRYKETSLAGLALNVIEC